MLVDLHLKHRPSTFSGVVGQTAAVNSLKKVLASGSNRAFIFTGESGVGKTTLARIIANTIGCDPANIVEIDAATYNGIEAMRSVTSALDYAPLGGPQARVIIVDEAHALSKAAWQSLLKSVEEPPPGVYWCFCTTEASKIPDTIRTRCVVYPLSAVKTADIYELLKSIVANDKIKVPDDVVFLCAERATGSPRRGITALAQVAGCTTRAEAAELLQMGSDADHVLKFMQAIIKGGLTWAAAMKLVEPLTGTNAEGIRISMMNYTAAVLKNTKSDEQAAKLLNILEAFSTPYENATTLAPLLLSVGRILYA